MERYLRGQDLPIVVVTHDREFMNRVCNRLSALLLALKSLFRGVVETVEGMTYSYEGRRRSPFLYVARQLHRVYEAKGDEDGKVEEAMGPPGRTQNMWALHVM